LRLCLRDIAGVHDAIGSCVSGKHPIGIETFPVFVPSLTLVKVIAMSCAFGTPEQFTVTTLPFILVVAGCPAHEAEPMLAIGPGNVTTIV